jgi:hypothetical protein
LRSRWGCAIVAAAANSDASRSNDVNRRSHRVDAAHVSGTSTGTLRGLPRPVLNAHLAVFAAVVARRASTTWPCPVVPEPTAIDSNNIIIAAINIQYCPRRASGPNKATKTQASRARLSASLPKALSTSLPPHPSPIRHSDSLSTIQITTGDDTALHGSRRRQLGRKASCRSSDLSLHSLRIITAF